MIKLQCKSCGQKLHVPDEHAGKRAKCPKCGSVCVIPEKSTKIRFQCESCGHGMSVPQIHAGKKGRCPKCKNVVVVPAVAALAALDDRSTPVKQAPPAPAGMVAFRCQMCDHSMQARQSSRGNLLECPSCGSYVQVPEEKAAAKEDATAPGGRGLAAAAAAGAAVPKSAKRAVRSSGAVTCPSCDEHLADDATVCVSCGVYARSGRPILTSRGADEDMLYDRSRRVISPISWIVPMGLYPVYSEAMGEHKPYATWAIAAATVLISAWFLACQWSGSTQMRSMKSLLLWGGAAEPQAEQILFFYERTNYGDPKAFLAKRRALQNTTPPNELDLAAFRQLNPQQRCLGQYKHIQLITHAFLHAGPFHLAGNMLFLLVFGSRVNSAIGNILTLILYPLLAIAAALTHLQTALAQPPTPMLGASGAVMGMAGVYLLLFPVHKVYLTAWARWGLITGFHLSFKVFAVRGFWVVLFYIMFDVIAVSLTMQTGTAHWAHIGGLLWGFAAGLVLLASRLTHSRSDVLSLMLGKYAWPLIGSPHSHKK